jgi:hypothetical protein
MPKADNTHSITAIITTTFKMVLMELAMGINLLMSHNNTPTIIKTITTLISGVISSSFN